MDHRLLQIVEMKICRKGIHANKPVVGFSIAVSILLEDENLKQKSTEPTSCTLENRLPKLQWERLLNPAVSVEYVNRREWLYSPANIKWANKDATFYAGRSTTLHILLFWAHTIRRSYVTKTILLISSSVSSKQLLCFVHGQSQKSEQKLWQRTLLSFITISFY